MINIRTCKKCNIEKTLEDNFYFRNDSNTYRHKCIKCSIARCRSYYEENSDKLKLMNKEHKANNKEHYREYNKKYQPEWVKNNPDKVKAKRDRYRSTEKSTITERNYYLNHKKEYLAMTNKRRAKKLSATPKWVNFNEIETIYKNCPEGHEVDHIIPLQGKNVSGLHVPWNLQYLTISENRSKGNKVKE